jgi:DNA-directed RNA polymerase sigma subunit (sigma70/sigma32)
MRLKLIGIEEKQLKDYIVVTLKVREVTPDTVVSMAAKMIKTEDATVKNDLRRMLIESHLKLVINIASRYRGAGLTFAALIVAGNSGLIKAAKNYSVEETRTFQEYVSWNIEGAIIDALIESRKESRWER